MRPLRRPAARFLVTPITLAAFLSGTILPAFSATELTRAQYEECQARDDNALKSTITTIATDALKDGTKTIDYRALVNEQWRLHNLDRIIDSRVDIAVDEVKSETSWSERLKSLASSEQSQKLATTVAEKVYHSDAVKTAIEQLASGVAREVGKTIEFASADATGSLLNCLEAFAGPRYGLAMAAALSNEAGKDLTVDADKGMGEISSGAVLKETGGGLAGATILIVRRQLANLAARVGQRIVGAVLSRLVSVVAGGIGLVLIAKDIWDFRHGVLPIIATEMKTAATKEKVREEIAATLAEHLNGHMAEIAAATADQVMDVWHTFKRAHALVLRIAESNGAFRAFLDNVKPAALPRLDEIVSLLVATEGEGALLRRLNDGSLNAAVHTMPDKALEIARDTKSVAAALDWTALAGDKLNTVVEYEIHRRAAPTDFTRATLDRLLALDDRAAIIRLASVPREARDALFGLAPAKLKVLVSTLSEHELTTLASYLKGLQQGPRELILNAVAAEPARMQILASASVRDAIISSADQSAAAEIMLRESRGISPRDMLRDAQLAWDGRISPWLLWNKHPIGIIIAGLILLVLLAWLRRLFRPRASASANGS
jgi:hypothetical protein